MAFRPDFIARWRYTRVVLATDDRQQATMDRKLSRIEALEMVNAWNRQANGYRYFLNEDYLVNGTR